MVVQEGPFWEAAVHSEMLVVRVPMNSPVQYRQPIHLSSYRVREETQENDSVTLLLGLNKCHKRNT
jgi:hypothetical protein